MVSQARPSVETVIEWLSEVADPELPVLSIVDLGIVREVRWHTEDELHVVYTPTYSGCPATEVILEDISAALHRHGVNNVRLIRQLSPAWTTAWLSEDAKARLTAFGVVPEPLVCIGESKPAIACPNCASRETELLSRFASTPCKALYRCRHCLEPFDVFKCH